jgi:hypothetical protein
MKKKELISNAVVYCDKAADIELSINSDSEAYIFKHSRRIFVNGVP